MIRFNFTSLLFFLLFFSLKLFPQNKIEFSTELFRIYLGDKLLTVESINGIEIYSKEFQNPFAYSFDLDSDGIDEYLVKDSIESNDSAEYLLYIYNLLDTFYLSAEINSGFIEPYETFSGEIEGLIIVSGNSDFSYLNEGSEFKSLPINCWRFEEGEIYLVNEELYEIFLTENENLLMKLEPEGINNCDSSLRVKSLLTSAYINYLHAGEIASAENLLSTFYLCEDLESFKEKLDALFITEN